MSDSSSALNPEYKQFRTTQWSMVIRAGRPQDSDAHTALTKLCERYWLPIHAYVRRRVSNLEEARDVTQAFFTHLLEKNTVAHAAQSRGRFRSFLLTSIKNFIINDYERKQAQKRGGDLKILSLDFETGESRMSHQPAHNDTPERIFEKQWALSLLETVARSLQEEYASADKGRQFLLLQGAISASEKLDYPKIADELAVAEESARQMATRLRRRYRELLREEVAHTVNEPSEVEDELRGLFSIFAD